MGRLCQFYRWRKIRKACRNGRLFRAFRGRRGSDQSADQLRVRQVDAVAAVGGPDHLSPVSAGEIGPHDVLPQSFDLPGLLLGGTAELPDLPAGNVGVMGHQGDGNVQLPALVQQALQLPGVVSAVIFR